MKSQVVRELEDLKDPRVAFNLSWFFKTEVGGYGEGDKFLGIKVPRVRAVAKKYKDLSLVEIESLAQSEFHEVRFCALAILTSQFEKSKYSSKPHFDLYMKLMDQGRINNWDLIDITAVRMGNWLVNQKNPMPLLRKLAKHKNLWHQRLAVMFTAPFIKAGFFEPTLEICQMLQNHEHDLIHKASGWMLREVGKVDSRVLKSYLEANAATMPRTMLRYAIEKFPESQRKHYLAMRVQPQLGRGR